MRLRSEKQSKHCLMPDGMCVEEYAMCSKCGFHENIAAVRKNAPMVPDKNGLWHKKIERRTRNVKREN